MGRQSATSLAPGFRFHPTDEELVRYYLRRKVCGKSLRFDAISEIDIYKTEPWDLPDLSRLKTRDLEWYFFSFLDKKYGNGSKTNRATEKGYWKTTGKDRPIYHYSRIVGMKKTLVYHHGRAPRGQRSNWVMHEYRLVDEELEKAGVGKDAFVLCRIFQKSGTGPKNGERYGAPLIEEEWEDEDDVTVPGEHAADEVVVGDDAYIESDVEQNVGSSISPENAPVPSNFYYGDTSNCVEDSFENPPPSFDYYGDSGNYVEDASNLFINEQKPFIGITKDFNETNLVDDQQFFNLPEHYEEHANPVKIEDFIETTNEMNPMETNYQLYEPSFDAIDQQPSNEGLFLETNDLSCPVEPDPSSFDMLDEYLAYFNENGDYLHYMPPESLETLASETKVSNEESISEKCTDEEIKQLAITSKKLSKADESDAGSSSNHQNPEDTVFESDVKYPFLKKAKRMLGNFPAPPAFAADYPTKDKALRLGTAAQSPSSIRVTAGIVQIRNTISIGNWVNGSYDKTGNLQLTISITLPPSDTNTSSSDILVNFLSHKTVSAMSWSWFFFMLFWVLILPISYKLGTYVYAQ